MTLVSRRKMLVGGSAVLFSPSETVGRVTSLPETLAQAPVQTLVCVLLRGGADALSLVIPYGDAEYFRARPRIAVAPPGAAEIAAVELGHGIGLHPALAPLLPIFRTGELLIALGVGLSDPNGGHSEAERRLRALFPVPQGNDVGDAESDGTMSLVNQLSATAARIEAGKGPAVHWIEHGGWDTHVAQPSRIASLAEELAAGLLVFHRSIERRRSTTVLAVFSEFGRTLHENVTLGTGDGQAGLLFLLGAAVRGGCVFGYHDLARTDTDSDALPAAIDLAAVLKTLAPVAGETGAV